MSQYIALVHLDYVPVVNSYDEVVPGNIGALQKGLEARLSEDARDNLRANALWAEGKALLAEESEAETGPGAEGTIEVQDDFNMNRMGMNCYGWADSGYYGYGG